MYYLSDIDLITINTRVLLATNQISTIRNPAGLDSITQLPQQAFFGREAYPTIEQKLGIVFIKIINLHPFADGNKRTAVLALWQLSRLNGYDLTYVDENFELAHLALTIATQDDSDLNYDDIYNNIASHLQPLSD